jgi:hypothetical protein
MAWPEHHKAPRPLTIKSVRRCKTCKVVQVSEREPGMAELCSADCTYSRTWGNPKASWLIPVPNHKAVLAAFLLMGWDGIVGMVDGVWGSND